MDFDGPHEKDPNLCVVHDPGVPVNPTEQVVGVRKRRLPRWLMFVLFGALLPLMLMAVWLFSVVRALSSPPLGELPTEPDAVVVFGGEDNRTRLALELMAGGVAPILVVSHGLQDNHARELCGQKRPFEVMCVEPTLSSTRGEARMFAELAEVNGWTSLIAVTGDYHVLRARTYLARCYEGDFGFVAWDWPYYNRRILIHETLGNFQARFLSRGC